MSSTVGISGYFASATTIQHPAAIEGAGLTGYNIPATDVFGKAFTFSISEMFSTSDNGNNMNYDKMCYGGSGSSGSNSTVSSASGSQSGASAFEQFFEGIITANGSHFTSTSSSGAVDSASANTSTAASATKDTDTKTADNTNQPSDMGSIFQMLQQMMTAMNQFLQNTMSTASSNTMQIATVSFAEFSFSSLSSSASASGGSDGTFGSSPLDQFLTKLSSNSQSTDGSATSGSALTDAQKQQVQDILTQFQNDPANDDTFQKVHDALKQAGISLHPHGHHHPIDFPPSAEDANNPSQTADPSAVTPATDSSAADASTVSAVNTAA